nr:hypothetical protein [Bacillus cereus]
MKNTSDSDGQDLLFTNQLKEQPTDCSVEFLGQNNNEVQEFYRKFLHSILNRNIVIFYIFLNQRFFITWVNLTKRNRSIHGRIKRLTYNVKI